MRVLGELGIFWSAFQGVVEEIGGRGLSNKGKISHGGGYSLTT